MLAHAVAFIAILFYDFARDCGERSAREVKDKLKIGLKQLNAKRVPIQRTQPRDVAVVVEAACFLGILAHGLATDEFVFQQVIVRRRDLWVEQSLDRIHVVRGDQLALLAVERGVRREKNPWLHPQRERPPVGRGFD